jgi:uncharacterized protein (TIGR04255 family)
MAAVPESPNAWPRFPNAPIKEAILDIRVELPHEIGLDQLLRFQDAIQGQYPHKRERVQFSAELHLEQQREQQQSVQPSKKVDGYVFTSVDSKDIVQARLDGFTINRVQPYDAWPSFRDTGKRLWEHYLSIATPTAVTRIALRYINRLELPLPIKDFKEYLLTVPEIAPSLPQGLKTFFMRLEIPSEQHQAIAIITETMEAPVDGKLLPVILDIDAIRESPFPPRSEEIWQTFENLREFKNQIFFQSVTDKAKELFK